MRPLVLNPPSSTSFLLSPDGERPALAVDMQTDAPSLAEGLRKRGHDPAGLAALLITHHHPDHFQLPEARALAEGGTEVFIGRQTWDELRERIAHIEGLKHWAADYAALEASGRLWLLDPTGTRAIGGRSVAWATFPHGDAREVHANLAWRIDDWAFSGDAATGHFLNPDGADAETLFGLQRGGVVRGLALNIAQFTREDIATLDLPDHRKANYLKNHGILEDVVSKIADPRLRSFFAGLEELIVYHVRREPIGPSAEHMVTALAKAARSQGFTFRVALTAR